MTESHTIPVTPQENRPFSAGHLWEVCENDAPDASAMLFDLESYQRRYDTSNGSDEEAAAQITILKEGIFSEIVRGTSPDRRKSS